MKIFLQVTGFSAEQKKWSQIVIYAAMQFPCNKNIYVENFIIIVNLFPIVTKTYDTVNFCQYTSFHLKVVIALKTMIVSPSSDRFISYTFLTVFAEYSRFNIQFSPYNIIASWVLYFTEKLCYYCTNSTKHVNALSGDCDRKYAFNKSLSYIFLKHGSMN